MDNPCSSVLLDDAVKEFSKLPGIGKKTALRLVLHLLRQSREDVEQFGNAFIALRNGIHYCKVCHNISDAEICGICADERRDASQICVVENINEVISIENTQQFHGLYHVLGGVISPVDGIGPSDLAIDELIGRLDAGGVKEVILALSPTMEGDTTNFYLYKKLSKYEVDITTIARGVSIGDELEYADEVTLGRSILNRTPYKM
ncbi:MAG: recombination protein RecR [Paludibacteraceae bacterium]|jgi:recombination protein RecR|nr:recombination protein RecR [Paludibacteraceae bacterium]